MRIANCSGFYGDRLSAAREMIDGGPIDYLTGDYLAELTMAVLWRTRHGRPGVGYARTFLTQIEDILGSCVERGIRVVVNAGGLDPHGLAKAVQSVADDAGLSPLVATVAGDDLMGRIDQLDITSFADATPFSEAGIEPITANAYLGCWGIVEALSAGADIVVTGRVTDAALVMGPAAHHFGWARDQWDPLAGALVAGHVIECGAQATGGNFSFFTEVPGLEHPGFPLVEMAADGSFVVTKHPETGGLVSVETVTAQLLYEIGGHRYISPDVIARFDTLTLSPAGTDRVSVTGVRGEPPPHHLKVAVNYHGGYRNRVSFVLTGLDIEGKARAAEEALWAAVGGRDQFADTHVDLVRWDRPDPARNEDAMAQLRISVKDPDQSRVGRSFTSAAVELALSNYPGFFTTEPPADASPYAVYWPAFVDPAHVPALVTIDGTTTEVPSDVPGASPITTDVDIAEPEWRADEATELVPLGWLAGTRSGDKGGDANVGVWVRRPEWFGWLASSLTVEGFRSLVPEAVDLEVDRYVFPNLSALNFVVRGLLGEGVASSTRVDPQAKSLGEYLRARLVEVPSGWVQGTGVRPGGTISTDT
ncbi:DUF1446 domain-containing protein [soil metagenome]